MKSETDLALSELIKFTKADSAFLITRKCNILSQSIRTELFDPEKSIKMFSGLMSVSESIIQILGCHHLESVLVEGNTRNIQLCKVNDSVLLLVVFSDMSKTGLIRQYSRKVVEQVRADIPMSISNTDGGSAATDGNDEFSDYLLANLSEIILNKRSQ